MCGRYEFNDERDIAEVRSILKDLNSKYDFQVKKGEVFPTNDAAILKAEKGKPVLTIMSWGFPKWENKGSEFLPMAKTPYGRQTLHLVPVIINARSETVHEKKMFKKPISQFRCVVPATGFYEWQKKDTTKKKDKYLFTSDREPMIYMAGIYNVFQHEDGDRESFVILTQDANEHMADIHDRQPVMLYKEELKNWLMDDNFVDFAMARTDIGLYRELVED